VVAKRSRERHPKEGSLGAQVEEMVTRLFGVIRDSLKLKEMSWDPERTVELYYQISKGFIDSPDLRVTWLENLSQYHAKQRNYEECAQTKIFTAALISGYLRLLHRFPKDIAGNFQSVFPNLERDLTLPLPASLESLEGEICQGWLFSAEGFVDLLKQAIGMLKMGELYESCVEVYRLLLPIHQVRRDYAQQGKCYQDLFGLCNTIVKENEVNQRMFANYYRVAFYGEKFEEFNGTEYVYKESNSILITEFTDRLKVPITLLINKAV
jgi:hypothetical protein